MVVVVGGTEHTSKLESLVNSPHQKVNRFYSHCRSFLHIHALDSTPALDQFAQLSLTRSDQLAIFFLSNMSLHGGCTR